MKDMRDLVSALVLLYLRRVPWRRGKWRVLRWASSFLVVEVAPGARIRIADTSSAVEIGLAMRGMQERQDRQLLLSLLCPGMTALDIGANVGTYALPFATRVGKTGHVHAFEPSPSVASRLRTNVEISGLNNVSVQEVAVSDNARGAQLHFAEDDDRNSLAGASHRSIMVSTTTLDDYLAAHGINGVDVMKIDVEGAEALVLRGACKLLSSESAPVIMIEINPAALRENGSCADEVIDLLARYGYTAYQMSVYDEGTYANVLAMQPRHTHRYSALHHRPDRVFEPRQLKDPGN